MENFENKLHQTHITHEIEENGVSYFLKLYKPDSYEIKNEISWLMSSMINSCQSFEVPKIVDASVKEGYVKMNYIDVLDSRSAAEMNDYLIACALELHSLIKTDQPRLRTPISKDEYNPFLLSHIKTRIDSISKKFEVPAEIVEWMEGQIGRLRVDYFSIVHRDLRARHLLFSQKEKPTLIDWEFSNISEPAQDLAKLIYDGTLNGLDQAELRKKVVDIYAHENHISSDHLEQRILTFAPIMPLENSMALINRKPIGYEKEVLKDLYYIRALYEENKG